MRVPIRMAVVLQQLRSGTKVPKVIPCENLVQSNWKTVRRYFDSYLRIGVSHLLLTLCLGREESTAVTLQALR